MANRVVPTSLDADNSAGSRTLAACTDWRSKVRRFHVGTGLHEPTSDAGYTTAGSPLLPQLSINLLPCGGSPYRKVRPQPRSTLAASTSMRHHREKKRTRRERRGIAPRSHDRH